MIQYYFTHNFSRFIYYILKLNEEEEEQEQKTKKEPVYHFTFQEDREIFYVLWAHIIRNIENGKFFFTLLQSFRKIFTPFFSFLSLLKE